MVTFVVEPDWRVTAVVVIIFDLVTEGQTTVPKQNEHQGMSRQMRITG